MIGEGKGQRAVDSGYATDVTSCVSAEDTVARLPATSVNRFDDVEVSDVGFRDWSVYGDQGGGTHTTPGTYYLTLP